MGRAGFPRGARGSGDSKRQGGPSTTSTKASKRRRRRTEQRQSLARHLVHAALSELLPSAIPLKLEPLKAGFSDASDYYMSLRTHVAADAAECIKAATSGGSGAVRFDASQCAPFSRSKSGLTLVRLRVEQEHRAARSSAQSKASGPSPFSIGVPVVMVRMAPSHERHVGVVIAQGLEESRGTTKMAIVVGFRDSRAASAGAVRDAKRAKQSSGRRAATNKGGGAGSSGGGPERRWSSDDGGWYTRQEFLLYYGDVVQWKAAAGVDAPPPPAPSPTAARGAAARRTSARAAAASRPRPQLSTHQHAMLAIVGDFGGGVGGAIVVDSDSDGDDDDDDEEEEEEEEEAEGGQFAQHELEGEAVLGSMGAATAAAADADGDDGRVPPLAAWRHARSGGALPGGRGCSDRDAWQCVAHSDGCIVGHMRAYEACCAAPLPLFVRALLGAKNRGHIRFDESGEVRAPPSAAGPADASENENESESEAVAAADAGAVSPLHLNPSQRRALEDFSGAALEGRSRLMLLQGPPGSGKSTFLVALLRRLHSGSRPGGGKAARGAPPGGAFGSGPGGRLRIAAMAPSNTAVRLFYVPLHFVQTLLTI